jgi:tRNA dimethylallyltransferase
MEPVADDAPLIVVLGQTGSGKSTLALDLAQRFKGEIIAADSRTVYKGMDIGTAKPSVEDRQLVPHHLIDIVAPDEPFTAADFQRQARVAIGDIAARGRVPIMVGGSGLYIDAVLYDFNFQGAQNVTERDRLQKMSVEELQGILIEHAIALPKNEKNPRHLVGAVLHDGVVKEPQVLRSNTLVIGLRVEEEKLAARIRKRTEKMIAQGLEQEVRNLVEVYGWKGQLTESIGYQDFQPHLNGARTLQDVVQQIVTRTMQYAKRQKTWFKRSPDISWISNPEEAVALVTTFLNK